MRRAATVGAIVFVLATGVTPAVAASGDISVSASAPSEATVSETVRVQFEVTNDGAEPTDALGLQVESLPPGFEVVGIESSGAVASERNAVFWTDPVQPGESVGAVVSVRVTEAPEPGDRVIRAVAATNETETQATARLSVRSRTTPTRTAAPTDTTTGGGETPGNGGAADGGSGGLPTIEPLTAVAALGVVAVLLLLR